MARLFPLRSETPSREGQPRVVDLADEDADAVFGALSSTTARRIYARLDDEPGTPSDIADAIDSSIQNVRYHLEKLEDAGLVEVVDTWYSSRGNEMSVYATADGPLIVTSDRSRAEQLKDALSRFLGGVAGLAGMSLLVQYGLSEYFAPTPTEDGAAGGDGAADDADGAEGDDAAAGDDRDGGTDDAGDSTDDGETEDDVGATDADEDGADAEGDAADDDGGGVDADADADSADDGTDGGDDAAGDDAEIEDEADEEADVTDEGTDDADAGGDDAVDTDADTGDGVTDNFTGNDSPSGNVTENASEVADGAADVVFSTIPPGLLFFLGGLVVLTAVTVYWYWRSY